MFKKFIALFLLLNSSFVYSQSITDDELRSIFIVSQNYMPYTKPSYGGIILYKGYFDKVNSACSLKNAFPNTLIFVDQEGGDVNRIEENAPPEPRNAIKIDTKEFEQLISKAAITLKNKCLDVNLAPSIEITGEKRNYGNDEETVKKYSTIFIKAMNTHGVLTINKHFPPITGHTCINVDNLKQFNIKINSNSESSKCVPYAPSLFESNMYNFVEIPAQGIMVNSNLYPKFNNYPAFMNPEVKKYLREDLKYEKLVISDATWGLELNHSRILEVVQTVDMMMIGDANQVEKFLPFFKKAIEKKLISTEEIRMKIKRIANFKNSLKKPLSGS